MTGDKLIIERCDNQWTAGISVLLEAPVSGQAGMIVTGAKGPGMVLSTHIREIQLQEETV